MGFYPGWLKEKAFGGTQSADSPESSIGTAAWPIGACAPGAKQCCAALLHACEEAQSDVGNCIVFLVGGAGNGKSHLAKTVTDAIDGKLIPEPESGPFAKRSYKYDLAKGGNLHVLNDATIPPSLPNSGSDFLVQDIQDVLRNNSNFLACVNRGVLISEYKEIDDDIADPFYSTSAELLKWLLGNGKPNDANLTKLDNMTSDSEYYAYCEVTLSDGKPTRIHVAFMDQASLFEPQPDVSDNEYQMGALKCPPIKIALIDEDQRNQKDLPGYIVLSELLSKLKKDSESSEAATDNLDPVRANIESLADPLLLNSICSIIRGAEIITGHHLTYRDLWGVAVNMILGANLNNDSQLHSDVVAELNKQSKEGAPIDRVSAVIQLASRRSHMSLFGAEIPKFLVTPKCPQSKYPPVQAMLWLKAADPLVALRSDIIPIVKDKLKLLNENQGPGQALADEYECFRRGWTDLDAQLEEGILALLDDDKLSFTKRNQLLSWYGQYLFRLYAFTIGAPAYFDEILMWQRLWNSASTKTKNIKGIIERGLNNLIFTRFGQDTIDTLLPVFAPKVVPIQKDRRESHIAIKVKSGQYAWTILTSGTSIVAELKKFSQKELSGAQLVIDMPMLREIIVQGDTQGFTEASLIVDSRVERIRAKILAQENDDAGNYMFIDNGVILE